MLFLEDPGLEAETEQGLNCYQAMVMATSKYPQQVADGKILFARYNKRTNPVFNVIRKTLVKMCSGAQRCGYCEDSVGDEIEHIKPKDLYPEQVFEWTNYLLACGRCNGGKSNKFSVIVRNQLKNVTRRRKAPIRRPGKGEPGLINPRNENPLDFLDLEIVETFIFLPRKNLSTINEKRANYTIEVLKLNREVLRAARREAYGSYRARLVEYLNIRNNISMEIELNILTNAITTSAHPTVWHEMQRQHSEIEELTDLFTNVPEALAW